MEIRVRAPYPGSYLVGPSVDLRRFGVPTGGAADRESALYANVITRNPVDTPVLEVAIAPIEIQIVNPGADVGWVGVAGAGLNQTIQIDPESGLGIGPRLGERIYVALPGLAIKPPTVPVALGPEWMTLQIHPGEWRSYQLNIRSKGPDRTEIRYIPFNEAGTHLEARVLNTRSRVGVRLDADLPPHNVELPSEPCCPGTMQHTPSGELIVLGVDGPTTGGYPKLGTVIEADLDKIGQLTLGDSPRFVPISINQALEIRKEHRARLATNSWLLGTLIGSLPV